MLDWYITSGRERKKGEVVRDKVWEREREREREREQAREGENNFSKIHNCKQGCIVDK